MGGNLLGPESMCSGESPVSSAWAETELRHITGLPRARWGNEGPEGIRQLAQRPLGKLGFGNPREGLFTFPRRCGSLPDGPSQRHREAQTCPSEWQGLSYLGRERLEGACEPEIWVHGRGCLWGPGTEERGVGGREQTRREHIKSNSCYVAPAQCCRVDPV